MAKDKQRIALVTGGMGGLGEAICVARCARPRVTTHSPNLAQEWLDNETSRSSFLCLSLRWSIEVVCRLRHRVVADVGQSGCWSTMPASPAT